MKKILLFSLLGLAVICGIIYLLISWINHNPALRKPAEEIREDMLVLVPIGTSIEDIIALMGRRNDWKVHTRGRWWRWSELSDEIKEWSTISFVGGKTIWISMRGDGLGQIVRLIFYFDDNLELRDISVMKYVSINGW